MHKPSKSTAMVLGEQPFHSFRMIPHTLEKVTLSAIRMQKEKVMRSGESAKNPCPKDSPKNWLYHNAPANRQKTRLLPQTLVLP